MKHLRSKCANLRNLPHLIPDELNVSLISPQHLLNHHSSLSISTPRIVSILESFDSILYPLTRRIHTAQLAGPTYRTGLPGKKKGSKNIRALAYGGARLARTGAGGDCAPVRAWRLDLNA